MGRHEAGTDDRLSVADGRINGRNSKNPLLKETLCKGEGLGFAADEDRNDRALGGSDLETYRLEALMHLAGVLPEHLDAFWLGLHDLESLENSTGHGWSKRGREDEASSLVLHELDQFV